MLYATPITKIRDPSAAASLVVTEERDWWKGAGIHRYEYADNFSILRPSRDYYAVAHIATGGSRLVQRRDGKIHEGRVFAGTSIIVPRGYDAVYEGESFAGTTMFISHELVSRAADEIDRQAKASYEIINVFRTFDATIGNLTNLFLGEINQLAHPAQALISDALSTMLAGHLLRCYNAFDIQEHSVSGVGTRALSQVIAYIEDHSGTALRLDELANIAGVSRFHFSRLFKSTIGVSPMVYVEQARIRKAQQMIQSGHATLAEIALMSGFADQSHFTRRFQKHTGCTPAIFARHKGVKLVRDE